MTAQEGEEFPYGDSYDALQRKRRLAEALMMQGADASPVKSWTQGAARLAQSLIGGYESNKYDKQNKEYDKAYADKWAAAFGGGSPSPAPSTSVNSAPGPLASAVGGSPVPTAGGKSFTIPPQYMPILEKASQETGIPGPILAAKIQQEGQFRPDAVGAAGEIGMSQVLPSTARQPGYGVAPVDPERLRISPEDQIMFGARYLAGRAKSAGVQDWNDPAQAAKALTAYNGGGDPRYAQNVMRWMPAGAPQRPVQTAQAPMTPDGMPTSPVASDAPPMAYAAAPAGQAISGASPQPQARPPGQQLAQAVAPTSPPIPQPQPTGNVNAAMYQIMSDPRFSPQQKAQALQMFQMQQNQNKATYQTDADGNIIQLDPTGRRPPQVVYQGKVKPMTVARGGSVYDPQTRQFVTPPQGPGQQAELGLNPQYGVDENGNPVLIQLGKDGKGVRTQIPEGVKLSKEPIKIDAGTEYILLDPITRQPVGRIPKNVAETARQREVGEARGQAEASAPSQIAAADDALGVLNQIKTHKGMDNALGFRSNFPTVKGSDAYGFESLVEQARSGAFLTAIGQLKGMGALSNAEGQTATAAVTRMQIGQNKADFMKALEDYEKVVMAGKAKAQRLMQGGSASAPGPAQSDAGDGWQEIDGVRVRRVN